MCSDATALHPVKESAERFYPEAVSPPRRSVCPANTKLEYYYATNTNSFQTIGYFWLTKRPGGNFQTINVGPGYQTKMTVADPVLTELVLDATLSNAGSLVNVKIAKVRTSHVNGKTPLGGQIGYMDNHVAWRNFSLMVARTTEDTRPTHWW